MHDYKEQGIVLHTIRYGENGLIVYLLTRGHGRMTYMVGGVRGGGSRRGERDGERLRSTANRRQAEGRRACSDGRGAKEEGGARSTFPAACQGAAGRSTMGRGNKAAFFQPMFPVEFEGFEAPGAEMHRMRELRATFPLRTVPFDPRKSAIAIFMAEVVYRLVREVEPNAPLYDFLEVSVRALDDMQAGVANFHLWFLVRLSSFLGFYPGNEYIAGSWFDITEGLFVVEAPSHRLVLSPRNAALLHTMMTVEARSLDQVALSGERRSEFLAGMLSYFGYHLDAVHNIRSVQILGEVF